MPSKLNVTTLVSLQEFEQNAARWNQLWKASSAYEATSRSEAIALWVRTFKDPANVRTIIVESPTGKLLAGIVVLVQSSRGLKKLILPVNEWINCGELMVSTEANIDEVTGLILDQLQNLGDVIEFDRVQFRAPQWRCLTDRLQRQGHAWEASRVQRVGMIDIGDDWDRYFQSLSGNHRSAVRRSEKKIQKSGDVRLLRIQNPQDDALQHWMKQAFGIEHRSWKAANGSSILATGMDEYFLNEAINARDCEMLDLWFLLLDEQPIAFEYCHQVKGHCHSYKIGYDEAFKKFGPGRLLRKMQLENLTRHFNSGGSDSTLALDTMGLLCNTKAKWVTRDYHIGRVTASLSMKGRLLVGGQQVLRTVKHRIRPQNDEQAEIKLGGASFSRSKNQPSPTVLPAPLLTPFPSEYSSPTHSE